MENDAVDATGPYGRQKMGALLRPELWLGLSGVQDSPTGSRRYSQALRVCLKVLDRGWGVIFLGTQSVRWALDV